MSKSLVLRLIPEPTVTISMVCYYGAMINSPNTCLTLFMKFPRWNCNILTGRICCYTTTHALGENVEFFSFTNLYFYRLLPQFHFIPFDVSKAPWRPNQLIFPFLPDTAFGALASLCQRIVLCAGVHENLLTFWAYSLDFWHA